MLHLLPICTAVIALSCLWQGTKGLRSVNVQAAAELPEIDADLDKITNTFAGAVACANAFWDALFDRLPLAKAVKSDTAQDYKALVENLLAGVSSCVHVSSHKRLVHGVWS
jgi:hypothetical protein